jgi:hypothetical protein
MRLQGRLRTATRRPGTSRWTGWVIPLAAAVAVSTAITGASAGTHGVTGVPRYYVDLGPVVVGTGGGPRST